MCIYPCSDIYSYVDYTEFEVGKHMKLQRNNTLLSYKIVLSLN